MLKQRAALFSPSIGWGLQAPLAEIQDAVNGWAAHQGNPIFPPQRAKSPSLACCCLHVASQGADSPLTGSTGQQDGDDGQQRAESQQGTATRTQHGARLKGHAGLSVR